LQQKKTYTSNFIVDANIQLRNYKNLEADFSALSASIIALFIGVVIGMPLGWVAFICAIDLAGRPKRRPPTKEEWKVM